MSWPILFGSKGSDLMSNLKFTCLEEAFFVEAVEAADEDELASLFILLLLLC